MKRSNINKLMKNADELFAKANFNLPNWAHWSKADWAENIDTAQYCHDHQMGWDITDFGEGDFDKKGLILFCVRNGKQGFKNTPPYAEKIMIVEENQLTPLHYHKVKMEDIIVRDGGNLVIEMFASNKDGSLNKDDNVTIRSDGQFFELKPGEPFIINPGQSITIPRLLYHRFYGQKGSGTVIVGEVSQVNDDLVDNYFYDTKERFTNIIEDEKPLYLLWSEVLG